MAEQWIIDPTKQLEHPVPSTDNKQWTKSMYRVPKIVSDVNNQAYEPKLASFGPYHHYRHHLLPMEQHKRRALIQFLRRIGKDKFLKLMIIDGCFVLEDMLAEKRSATKEQSEYNLNDPVFDPSSKNYVIPNLKRDVLLIENPFPLLSDDNQIDVKRRLNDYCKKNMHKWGSSFVHTYLKNPWVFISLIGGLVLLDLTIVQTVYIVMSYYKA
ncbi:hypothetical protein KSP40_PGU019414 [Platanthera guangdongensis]|uniref:Uncharacterized protein n=1 Tax=Platanthera guangdongensis TaxID=2320717 RepID=A0ABR2MQ83_9ASPA